MRDSTKLLLWSGGNIGAAILNVLTLPPSAFSTALFALSIFTAGACACAAAISHVEGR